MNNDIKPNNIEMENNYNNILKNYVANACKINHYEHFMKCWCQDDLYDKYKKLLTEQELKEVADNPTMAEGIKKYRLSIIPENACKKVFEEKKFCVCSVEHEELVNTIKLFENKYDFNDPRVFGILKSLLDIQLTAFRMQRESNQSGVMIKQYNKDGDSFDVVNPVEESKRRYNETFIKAIEVLNKIIEGEKHLNVNLELSNYKVYKREELYNDITSNTTIDKE